MDNDDKLYLQDMLDNIATLEQFLSATTKEAFLENIEKQFAVAHALEIVGEASAKLSESFRAEHAEIDWRGLKSMRNLLIHDYATVDQEEVWKAWEADIPDLKKQIEVVLG